MIWTKLMGWEVTLPLAEAYCVGLVSVLVCLRHRLLFAQVTPVSYSLIVRMEIQWELFEWKEAAS